MVGVCLAVLGFASVEVRAESADYDLGYEHGCYVGDAKLTGYLDDDPTDTEMYKSNADYRRGWNDGHRFCGFRGSVG